MRSPRSSRFTRSALRPSRRRFESVGAAHPRSSRLSDRHHHHHCRQMPSRGAVLLSRPSSHCRRPQILAGRNERAGLRRPPMVRRRSFVARSDHGGRLRRDRGMHRTGRRGWPVRIRRIAGLDAVEEAVGRATEMGRTCFFIAGIQDLNEMQTVAGITVLSHVAKIAAEYDARLEMPTARSLVMTTARETVQASYLAAGRPESYVEDNIYYVTDEQFGFAAFATGKMVREKPAACFYMGCFYAESLMLAETANTVSDSNRRHGRAGAAPILHCVVRLHADRRGILRRVGVPLGRSRSTRQPQRPGPRQVVRLLFTRDWFAARHRSRARRSSEPAGGEVGALSGDDLPDRHDSEVRERPE